MTWRVIKLNLYPCACANVQESEKGACYWNVQTTRLVKSYMHMGT